MRGNSGVYCMTLVGQKPPQATKIICKTSGGSFRLPALVINLAFADRTSKELIQENMQARLALLSVYHACT